METVEIYKLIPKSVLVTRDSARSIEKELARGIEVSNGELTLDFSSIGGFTPSFFDETLSVIEENAQSILLENIRIKFDNLPTQLSSKFSAVAKVHGLSITELNSKSWVVYKH